MTDIIATFTDRFEANMVQQNQPAAEMINARLQRIQELEQQRQQYSSSTTEANDTSSSGRHHRRDRIIQQATQQRSVERRNVLSSVQRTPIRSQSLDLPAIAPEASEESLSFRERFDSTRQNIFGPRTTGSSENLTSGSQYSRRQTDSPTLGIVGRAGSQAGSDSGSGSNTDVSVRPQYEFSSDVADILADLGVSSDINIASRETRSSSITRDIRNPSTNYQRFLMSNPSHTSNGLTTAASLRRESRSRYRRRTIEGVDSSVREALDINRSRVDRPHPVPEDITRTVQQSLVHSSSASEFISYTRSGEDSFSSGYKPTYRSSRAIELRTEETQPVLGFENEKVIFVDEKGHCHWLDKHHQLLRYIKGSNAVPEIVLIPKSEMTSEEDNGIVASIEGDVDSRIAMLRELLNVSRHRGEHFEGEENNGSDRNSSQNVNEHENDAIDSGDISKYYDEKYKSVIYYTPPRPRPNLEIYKSARTIFTVYDDVDMTDIELISVPHSVDTTQSTSSTLESANTQITTSSALTETSRTSQTVTETVASLRHHESHREEQNDGHVQQVDSYASADYESVGRNSSVLETFAPSFADNADTHDEVNCVLSHFQSMHENTGVAIDTSHLDLDELRMIQKVLEENPSPPMSPVVMNSPGNAAGLSPGWQTTVEEIPCTYYQTTDDDIYPSFSAPATSPHQCSSGSPEPRLALPSMDFSPMERNRTKENFSFSPTQDSVENNQVTRNKVRRNISVSEEQITPAVRSNGDDLVRVRESLITHHNELFIQIPDSFESTNRRDSYKSDTDSGSNTKPSVSPLVKSLNGSGPASPNGSETVSAVFDDFVTTVSEELAMPLPSHMDSR